MMRGGKDPCILELGTIDLYMSGHSHFGHSER
jgi:hypothetical protein